LLFEILHESKKLRFGFGVAAEVIIGLQGPVLVGFAGCKLCESVNLALQKITF
jgi:hypothetical protein